MAYVVFGVPLLLAAVVIATIGWNAELWSATERRTRLALGVAIGLVLSIGAVVVVNFAAWLFGPDCGQHPSFGVRLRVVGIALVVAAFASAVPVAVVGRRRVALLAAAPPVIASVIAALAATSPSSFGWCLF